MSLPMCTKELVYKYFPLGQLCGANIKTLYTFLTELNLQVFSPLGVEERMGPLMVPKTLFLNLISGALVINAGCSSSKWNPGGSVSLCALSNTEFCDSWCHFKRKGWLSTEGSELSVLCDSCVKPNKESYYPTFAHLVPPVPMLIPIPYPSHTHLWHLTISLSW